MSPIVLSPSAASLGLVLDPVSEDASNVALDLNDLSGTFLTGFSAPTPPLLSSFAGSADTEGQLLVQNRHDNRTVTVTTRVVGSSAADLQAKLGFVEQKVGKVHREGGTLQLTTPAGTTVTFDLWNGVGDYTVDKRFVSRQITELTATFVAKPYGRGAPVTLGSHTEATLPVLVFTEGTIGGDVPGLGRLIITEAQAVDQWWLTWGVQSRYYSSSADAALFYEAEGRTAQGGSATNTGPSGASGTSVMRSAALTTSYVSILGTQATGGGNHLAHVGDFNVYARVQTPTANTGAVSLGLEWAQGDFLKTTRNTAVTFPVDLWDATWRLVNLGQVSLSKVAQGTQRWEGRVLASSTVAGDLIDVDYLMFVPITEGSGTVLASPRSVAPTTFSARDEFDQTAGNLNTKTLPIGGAWATSGTATDFTVVAGSTHEAQRTGKPDAAGTILDGRFAIAGTTAFTNAQVTLDHKREAVGSSGQVSGILLRWVDASNFLFAGFYAQSGTALLAVVKVIAGTATTLASVSATTLLAASTTYTLQAKADAAGRFFFFYNLQGAAVGDPLLRGQDAALATGGTLASGKSGFYESEFSNTATRHYDNFAAWVPPGDAAVFASRQAEIRSDRYIRQDSAGVVWADKTIQGDYLLIPPSGREGRTDRIIAKLCRNDPTTMPDSAIDDITAQLVYTPRYLALPE